MDFFVEPASLTGGTISVPGDKSISHRALMLGSIAEGSSEVTGFLAGDDCLCTMAALRNLGVRIDRPSESTVIVHGVGLYGLSAPRQALEMGNSGTAMRLFCGLLCGQAFDSELCGDESLSARPMGRVIRPLSDMGARIASIDGLPPLNISGRQALSGIDYAMPVASAQVKSALLLAGLYAHGVTRVTEPATTRDHTERMLQAMGVVLERRGASVALRGGQSLSPVDIEVPADLSSAAFLLVAAIISGTAEVTVPNVGVNPTRTGVLDILRAMGASLEVRNERMLGREPVADVTARATALHGVDVDPQLVSLAIDEFPLLFVAAAFASGSTRFAGIGELRVKESDRIGAMARGLRNLGIEVSETDDCATVHGGRPGGGTVDSDGDHRVAMAFAVAGTRARGPVMVRESDAVDTSFPGFAACLQACGARLDEHGRA